jgi:hypothetical protein
MGGISEVLSMLKWMGKGEVRYGSDSDSVPVSKRDVVYFCRMRRCKIRNASGLTGYLLDARYFGVGENKSAVA